MMLTKCERLSAQNSLKEMVIYVRKVFGCLQSLGSLGMVMFRLILVIEFAPLWGSSATAIFPATVCATGNEPREAVLRQWAGYFQWRSPTRQSSLLRMRHLPETLVTFTYCASFVSTACCCRFKVQSRSETLSLHPFCKTKVCGCPDKGPTTGPFCSS